MSFVCYSSVKVEVESRQQANIIGRTEFLVCRKKSKEQEMYGIPQLFY